MCQKLDTETAISQNFEPLGEKLRAAPMADPNPCFLPEKDPGGAVHLLLCARTHTQLEGEETPPGSVISESKTP